MFRTFALSAVAVAALGCQSESQRTTGDPCDHQASAKPAQAATASTRELDPFCHTYRILVNGVQRGFLLRYEEMPGYVTTERRYATGTAFIQNMDFEEIGFITPNGTVYRVGSGASPGTAYSERVMQGELLKGLSHFYDPEGAAQVTLESITQPPAAKSAAPTPKEAPKGNGEKAEAKEKAPAKDKAPAKEAPKEEKSEDEKSEDSGGG
jgi:hypothetical protein